MRSSPFHSNVLFLILYYYTSNSLLLYLQLNLAFEGDGGRTGHEDLVVGLVPFDVERAAIHADVALTTCSACEMSGNSGGASSSSTSEGDARTTFPYSHAEGVFIKDLGKLDVATLWKEWVMLQ